MKILILITRLPHNEMTVIFGGYISQLLNAEVTLTHVIANKRERTAGKAFLKESRAKMPPLPVESVLLVGARVPTILAEIKKRKYDLIILGARPFLRLTQPQIGPVTRAVLREANTSVLVVQNAPQKIEQMLICTGGMEVAQPVIESGARIASAAGAQVTLLHVAGTIPTMYTGLNEIDETLSELLKSDTPIAKHLRSGAEILTRHEVNADLMLRHGLVASEILREAHKSGQDMIVMGAKERGLRLKQFILDDVVGKVIESAPCPVLMIREPTQALTQTDPA